MLCVVLLFLTCGRPAAAGALTGAQAAAMFADGITTRAETRAGGHELDPLTRVFIGSRPTWSRMAPAGAAVVVSEAWLADRMRRSRHKWVRAIWWAPQAATIGANLWGVNHNVNALGHDAPSR